jgi:hypothetical protein
MFLFFFSIFCLADSPKKNRNWRNRPQIEIFLLFMKKTKALCIGCFIIPLCIAILILAAGLTILILGINNRLFFS